MINEAILVGRVGKKDTKTLNNGGEITVISMVTTARFKDSSGEKQVRETWHNINCFSKLSEIASRYVHVGDVIYIRGEINNKKIEKGERAGQYMYSITAQDIKFLPGGKKQETESKPAPKPAYKPKPVKENIDNDAYYEAFDDAVPF